ncbi:MAG: 50S ribosomal protein L28 [Candidatus Omnitrophota bacterium]|nr:50S ribosomal protein L28 [Candidatus Omnitrophota bacterium]
MSRSCIYCGKRAVSGSTISRRGLPKSKGGVGLKTTGISKRKFAPNLQPKHVIIDGKRQKVLVCTKCIKRGKSTVSAK